MTNYVKLTDFAAKDALVSGNPAKLIKGAEINDEFNALQSSIATKADLSSPAFQGNPTAATQALGNNSTRLANTAFVQQEIADAETAINITGGNISAVDITDVIITDANISGLVAPIAVADGGTGKTSVTSGAVLVGNGTGALTEVSPATTGNVIRTNGTSFTSSPALVLGTPQASTSGTAVEFTSIPSWVKRITIMFNGVSTNGSSKLQIQLGDSGGYETTGYVSTDVQAGGTNQAGGATATSGHVLIFNQQASFAYSGQAVFSLLDLTNNTWVGFSSLCTTSLTFGLYACSSKSLTATLDKLRITTVNGTDTFDAGTINIMYE